MILLAHLLFGAGIGNIIQNMPMAILLAFLSHYLLDSIPHAEYNIENIKNKQWQKAFSDFLKIFFDFCISIIFIAVFSDNQPAIYICAFFAILPDGLSLLFRDNFHKEKIHFLKYKKIPLFWRILSQILIVIISIILLRI
jgi:hypothetical protein